MYHYLSNQKGIYLQLITIVLLFSFVFGSVPTANAEETENVGEVTVENEVEESTTEKTEIIPVNEENVIESEDNEEEATDEISLDEENTTLPDLDETAGGEINTGDAEAGSNTENYVNTNIVDTTGSSSATSTEETETGGNFIFANSNDSNSASSSNNATTTTTSTTTASSGENNGIGTNTVIDTGDAVAYANVLNVVNTNIINSDGLVDFINDVLGYNNFNLQDAFNDIYTPTNTANSTTPCSLSACGGNGVNFNATNTNNANINNDITVVANTGGNTAFGSNSNINTGNAYASANVVNVANTNIIDSNYMLLVFNNFDNYNGNIVLPNSSFFDNVFHSGGNTYSSANINNLNNANINNNVQTGANSGENTNNGDNSSVNTGNAGAISDVNNTVNQNLTGGGSFSMLIKVYGDWNGEIFGLPAGMNWAQTPDGIRIFSTAGNGTSVAGSLAANNSNNATINNDVKVYALTGNNQTTGNNASISTGNAYADSNILNLANTNIVGQNWANLIFNIYGNWNGSLSFGQPNLWIGAKATSADSPIQPGSAVKYTFTIMNYGDTDAPNVVLKNSYLAKELKFNSPARTGHDGSYTNAEWDLGTIKAGETKEMTLNAKVGDMIGAYGEEDVSLFALAESKMPDADPSDNEEYLGISVGSDGRKGENLATTFKSNLEIEKTASRDIANPGDTVDYYVNFHNRGGQLFDAMLIDILENEAGEIVYQQSWPLGTIKNDETIKVDYSIDFNSAIELGTYTNSAQVIGYHGSQRRLYQSLYESPFATHDLLMSDGPVGEVLGETFMCEAYLNEFMRYGHNNNPEQVKRLQTFLNEYQGSGLTVSGYFDLETEVEVRKFQKEHAEEILTPWGLQKESGYVYLTTRKKVNEIMCSGTQTFPLAASELKEISDYRSMLAYAEHGIPLNPEPEKYGEAPGLPDKAIVQLQTRLFTQTSTPLTKSVKVKNFVEKNTDTFVDKLLERVSSWFAKVAEAAGV